MINHHFSLKPVAHDVIINKESFTDLDGLRIFRMHKAYKSVCELTDGFQSTD